MDPRDESEWKTRPEDRIRQLTEENVQLRDKNEILLRKLGDVQDKVDQAAGLETNLSAKLISAEEEKLKISRDLVELQIKTNKLREQYEEETFQLKNKILLQESHLAELEMDRDRLQRDVRSAREYLQAAEKNHKDLVDEYITLKSNHLALTQEHERLGLRNAELLGLVQERPGRFQGDQGQASSETDRVKVRLLYCSTNLPCLILTFFGQLLGKQEETEEELDRIKKSYEEQQRRLEEKVVAMGKEQRENKAAIRNTQKKLAEQSVVSVTVFGKYSFILHMWCEHTLQFNSHKCLDPVQLFTSYELRWSFPPRLLRFRISTLLKGTAKKQMKKFVDSMLQDIRASYRSREEQLASATRAYKKRLQRVIREHEALLIAYRMQREQILALGEQGSDPGPPAGHFSLTEGSQQPDLSQELHRFWEDKASLDIQQHVLLFSSAELGNTRPGNWAKVTEKGWTDIRKELRAFTYSTLEALERERVQLIARASAAEGWVAELQEYVDKHLSRYKEEILRLRRLLALEGGRPHGAADPEPAALQPSEGVTGQEL
uniref:Coiled-coil domain containing 78 n=1 Tax=Scleropages formosus TaxID=113540 RepID=A0A8C9SCI9_SCLFO